jgi:hypothetical protein
MNPVITSVGASSFGTAAVVRLALFALISLIGVGVLAPTTGG